MELVNLALVFVQSYTKLYVILFHLFKIDYKCFLYLYQHLITPQAIFPSSTPQTFITDSGIHVC